MASLSILLAALATFIFLYKLITFLRRRPARPLPPGPRPWPILGSLPHLGKTPHRNTEALARKYGPIMRFKIGFVDVIMVASASAASQFLKTHGANFANRPTSATAKYFLYDHQDMVTANGPIWQMLRKISSVHLFSGKALDDSRHIRQEEVGLMTRVLAAGGSEAVSLEQLLNLCVTNCLGRMMLGRRVLGDGSGRGDSMAEEFKSKVVEMMVASGVFNIGDFVPPLEWMDLQGVAAKLKELHKWFDAFLSTIIEEYKTADREGKQQNDMLSTLLSLVNSNDFDGVKLTENNVKALLLNMFTAGTDTTVSTVEWTIAELMRHPDVFARVRDELDSVVGRDRMVNELDLPKLTYLQAVIKENFRLHPPTPLSIPRQSSENCEINGYHIPKGSLVMVNVWAIARDPDRWSEPLVFRPERFLPGGENAEVDFRGNDFDLIPFGAGRRICVGMSLGIRMIQLLAATLVHAFEWELANGLVPEKLNMDEIFGITLQRAEPLIVHPKPRLAPEVYNN